jgi:predicted HAD superfamily phosphohydrolase
VTRLTRRGRHPAAEAVAAYRDAIACFPKCGRSWSDLSEYDDAVRTGIERESFVMYPHVDEGRG